MMPAPEVARWIVLTPSPADAAWRQALSEAATAAGLRMIDAHPDHPQAVIDDPRTLVVTNMPSVAAEAGRKVSTVIVPDPELSIGATGALFDLSMPQSLWVSSRILAEACDLGDETVVLDAESMARTRGPIEIVPGVVVTPPQPAPLTYATPDEEAAGAAVKVYRSGRPKVGHRATWGPAVFLYDERGSRDAAEVGAIDMTGRPRILVYGPYVGLPAGRWRLVVQFSIDEAATRRTLRIDWGTQADFVSHIVAPDRAGVYEIELEYDWTAAAPAEFRIILLEGAFSGTLIFRGGVVSQVEAAALSPVEVAA